MNYWLLVYLFDVEGQFQAKDIWEAASMEQCQQFAGEYAKTIINTKLQAQFHCISDEEYRGDEL
jgi:hypothetical protein